MCVGTYWIESQQFVYRTGKREMWDYREGELQSGQNRKNSRQPKCLARERRGDKRGVEIFSDDLMVAWK